MLADESVVERHGRFDFVTARVGTVLLDVVSIIQAAEKISESAGSHCEPRQPHTAHPGRYRSGAMVVGVDSNVCGRAYTEWVHPWMGHTKPTDKVAFLHICGTTLAPVTASQSLSARMPAHMRPKKKPTTTGLSGFPT
jgi:hypothetical protein